ncbi:MAG: alanine/glycine:cation symporter family protein, partial [Gammaproteobacteria bacterium]
IAHVAEAVVPLMALLYLGAALSVIVLNAGAVPGAIALILDRAFEPASGAGAGLWLALRWGFARGIFSNEAGLGSAAIAHAAARTNNAVEQGTVAMLGTFIDTLCLCTMTALVILVTGAHAGPEQGAALSATAFTAGIGGPGATIVGIGLAVFAFTTIIGWSYYGERCAEYLFGTRVIAPYRVIWIVAIVIGALIKLELVWTLADVFNGLMALPNLVALVLLSPVVFRLTTAARRGENPTNDRS